MQIKKTGRTAILMICVTLLCTGCKRYTFLDRVPFIRSIFYENDMYGEGGYYDVVAALRKTERPEEFTDKVLTDIKKLEPSEDTWLKPWEDLYESMDVQEMESPENPYEILVSDPDFYINSADDMLDRYFASYQYEELESSAEIEQAVIPKERYYTWVEVMSSQLLAGDMEKFAVCVTAKIHGVNPKDTIYDRYGELGGDNAVYCNLTVYGERVTDYSFEMKGIAQTEDVCGVIEEKYRPIRTEAPPISSNGYRLENETLAVTYNSGEDWITVPISMTDLFGESEDMIPTELTDGEYYISADKTFFTCRGGIIVSEDAGKTWEKRKIQSARYIEGETHSFTGVSGDRQLIYILVCGGRVVRQEGSILYVSRDWGRTWEDLGSANGGVSSLISGFTFFDSIHGMTAISGYETLRYFWTSDGGNTWEERSLDVPKEGYGMIYEPQRQGENFVFYVGQSEVEGLSGVVYKYISSDKGISWQEDGRVTFGTEYF